MNRQAHSVKDFVALLYALCFMPFLFSDLSITVDDKFCSVQFLQPHETKGMDLRGADPYLCAQSQFESVIEPCRGRRVPRKPRLACAVLTGWEGSFI